MSIISSPIFNEAKGSFGPFVMYTVNKKMRLRSKPSKYQDKKSEEQLAQRSRMKGVIQLYQRLDDIFKASWRECTKGMDMSGYNLFIKENIWNVISECCLVDPALLKISKGVIPLPQKLELSQEENGDFILSWDTSGKLNDIRYDDLLNIGVYGRDSWDKEMEILHLKKAVAYRSEHQCRFQLPTDREGTLHLYACFKGLYTNEYSDSIYLGSREV